MYDLRCLIVKLYVQCTFAAGVQRRVYSDEQTDRLANKRLGTRYRLWLLVVDIDYHTFTAGVRGITPNCAPRHHAVPTLLYAAERQ